MALTTRGALCALPWRVAGDDARLPADCAQHCASGPVQDPDPVCHGACPAPPRPFANRPILSFPAGGMQKLMYAAGGGIQGGEEWSYGQPLVAATGHETAGSRRGLRRALSVTKWSNNIFHTRIREVRWPRLGATGGCCAGGAVHFSKSLSQTPFVFARGARPVVRL